MEEIEVKEPTLQAAWRSAQIAGGCNACTDRTAPVVCEITIREQKIRLCPLCRSNLISLFGQMGSPSRSPAVAYG